MFDFWKKKDKKGKKFGLRADQIKDLAQGHGGCIASDRITVDGLKVGYMYREAPHEGLSGWMFLSGEETQEYLDNPDNAGIYNVNTIANYDPEIIPLLNKPVGSAFARKDGGKLLRVEGRSEELSVHQLTDEWTIRLGESFVGRKEEGHLVFVAPGRTLRISIWDSNGHPVDERLEELKKVAAPSPVERYEPNHPSLKRFGYLLLESDDERGARWALYGSTLSSTGQLLLSAYFDDKADIDWARHTWDSVEFFPRKSS